jgi:flagellin FlaB
MIPLPTNDDDDRGQVGIGTLIVFIAMVLVAAIAAGVLINTAGFLQTQAENTGTESTEQVSNNINVLSAVGQVASSNNTVGEVRMSVAPAAGSDAVNLEEVTIQYVSDDDFANLIHTDASDVRDSDTIFNTSAITAEDRNDNVMTDSSDRYEIVIYLNDTLGGSGPSGINTTGDNSEIGELAEGEEAELTITTDAGAQIVATIKVPDSLAGDTDGDTVTL